MLELENYQRTSDDIQSKIVSIHYLSKLELIFIYLSHILYKLTIVSFSNDRFCLRCLFSKLQINVNRAFSKFCSARWKAMFTGAVDTSEPASAMTTKVIVYGTPATALKGRSRAVTHIHLISLVPRNWQGNNANGRRGPFALDHRCLSVENYSGWKPALSRKNNN